MLERNVLINDAVYTLHDVSAIGIEDDGWVVYVESWKSHEDMEDMVKSPVSRMFRMGCDTSEAYATAYGFISNLPEFAEYIDEAQVALDEILPILTDEQAEQVPNAFPLWKLDTAYRAGDRVRYDGKLYRCLSNHTSQVGYEPDIAVSLWARIGEGDIPEWVQPTSANPYMKGDLVKHNLKIWRSLVDNNVWEPGSTGSEALWEEVQ